MENEKSPHSEYAFTTWKLPHADAQDFLESCVQLFVEKFERYDNSRPEAHTDEFQHLLDSDDDSHLFPERVSEFADEYYDHWWDQYAPEIQRYIENLPEFRELIQQAYAAIESGGTDDLLSALHELASYTGADVQIENTENWSGIRSLDSETDAAPSSNITRELVIAAINRLSDELCLLIARDGMALQFIEWRQLEHVIATALAGVGFSVTLTPSSKDGGKDVVAQCSICGAMRTFYIEIKHWRSAKLVDSQLVFDFLEVNAKSSTDGGLFLSTSGFTDDAVSHLTEFSRQKVRLGNEKKIVTLCQRYTRTGLGLWTSKQSLPEILFEKTLT